MHFISQQITFYQLLRGIVQYHIQTYQHKSLTLPVWEYIMTLEASSLFLEFIILRILPPLEIKNCNLTF